MRTSLVLALPVLFMVAQSVRGAEVTFYVSPQGRDTWSGKLAAPDAQQADGPFATVARAQAAVRQARAAGGDDRYTVLIRGGTYYLSEPLRFGPQDSGSAEAPVTYAAYEGEKPVFSGGRALTGWRKGPGELWTVTIPEVAAGGWYFHQLFVNGERRTRARHPNEGYLHTAGPLPEITNPNQRRGDAAASMGFTFQGEDIRAWDGLEDVNIFLYHSWTASMHWIDELDEAARTVRFTARCGWPVCYWEREQRYHLENYREALDQPGEWYLERKSGTLYYWPLPGEDMARVQAVAPVLEHLVEIAGDPRLGLPVEHLTLRGLSFQHADWLHERDQTADGQAAIFLTGAIHANGARHCSLEDCEVAHCGEYGVWLESACQDNRIVRCEVHDLGGGAIKIGEALTRDDDALLTQRNTVDNCFLHDGGHVFPAGVGVWIGRNSYNEVTHNEVCDFFYTGVSVGWSWGYAPSSAHDNHIEWNHIHHIGMGVLSDLGGIYTLGQSQGTRLTHNLIHDIYEYRFGAACIYPDEGSTDLLIENNLCYSASQGGFSQHYGRDNIVRNNIFALCGGGEVKVHRVEEHDSIHFTRNIVYSTDGELVGGNWGKARLTSDYNCWWDTVLKDEAYFGDWDLEDWREAGQDQHSIIADPGFVDPEGFDFRLKPNSPALEVGFEPFDLSTAGLYGDPAWVEKPRKITRPPVEPPPPPPPPLETFEDDFEDTPVGEKPKLASMGDFAGDISILVSDEEAAGGRHSLKFTDAPGQEYAWQPHMRYGPRISKGTVRLAFDVLLREGAVFTHEWRDWRMSPYQVGPTLSFVAGGEVTASDRAIAAAPVGKWIHVEIVCPVGRKAEARYDVTVTVAGGEGVEARGIEMPAGPLKQLNWVGFISNAETATAAYLDNVRLTKE